MLAARAPGTAKQATAITCSSRPTGALPAAVPARCARRPGSAGPATQRSRLWFDAAFASPVARSEWPLTCLTR